MGQQGKVKAKESLANKIPGEEWVEADLRTETQEEPLQPAPGEEHEGPDLDLRSSVSKKT